MDKEYQNFVNDTDGAIVEGAVRREMHRDLGEMAGAANHFSSIGNWNALIKTQWAIVTVLAQTIIRLEKRNLLMDKDYNRGR